MADLSSLLGSIGIGGAIGQAIVRLELDTSKYLAEMKAAEGQTVASANAMGTSTSKFAGLASNALLGVGIAAVAGAALSVKAAIEANDAHLKLQNTFDNNKNLADSSVAAFERQADSLRDLTGVDDEAIISAQALLGQFKNLTGNMVQQLIPAVVDLSAKMDIDLQAAAKAVGKATAGNAGILSRYGIVLDESALKADAFGATLDGLGVAAGFAAKRADNEPWRILGAQLEEVAEDIGQALLPLLQDLANILTDVLVPALAAVAKGVELAFDPETYTDIPIIGEVFKDLGTAIQGVADATDYADASIRRNGLPMLDEMKQVAGLAKAGFINLSETFPEVSGGVNDLGRDVHRFAHMTGKDLKDWSKDVGESFDDFVLTLDETTDAAIITRKEFVQGSHDMLERARDLSHALRDISKEKWINDEYLEFLHDIGPSALIGFANLNETQQRKMQAEWEKSTGFLEDSHTSLEKMIGTLDKLDRGTTKHDIFFQYHYEGFDPTKPGMSAQQR